MNQRVASLFEVAIKAHQQGDLIKAESAYFNVLDACPDHPQALNLLGVLRAQGGDLLKAEQLIRRALACGAGWDALGNLARVLVELGNLAGAEQMYLKALEYNPGYTEALIGLGGIYHQQNKIVQAEECYGQALTRDPNSLQALSNLGGLLMAQFRYPEAEIVYSRVLQLNGATFDVYYRLGLIYFNTSKYHMAAEAYRKALRINPLHADAALKLAYVNRSHFSWRTIIEDDDRLSRILNSGGGVSVRPFARLVEPNVDAHALRKTARLYAEQTYKNQLNAVPLTGGACFNEHDLWRIGYISADIYDHATMHLLIGVMEAHDASKFRIYVYNTGAVSRDDWRRRLINAAYHFVDVATDADQDIARRILDDEIDILVDLKGYTRQCRSGINAYRPAPIIVNWLGYPGTLGHPRIADYIIGDPVVTPLDHAPYYSEMLALMPYCYQPNDQNRSVGLLPDRSDEGLPAEGFVFCSFNQAYKLSPEMFDTWCGLLRNVPKSVLWLLDPGPEARVNIEREAVARGVAPSRLVYAAKRPMAEHLGRLALADLALDTYPYTSHTTGSDALWVGVPLITRMGETFASRVAASLLHAVGLPELVTTTQNDYYQLAFQLATNSQRLRALRASLFVNRFNKPLFNTKMFVCDLERLYLAMIGNAREGIKAPIVLSPYT